MSECAHHDLFHTPNNVWTRKSYNKEKEVEQLWDVEHCLMGRSITYHKTTIPENKAQKTQTHHYETSRVVQYVVSQLCSRCKPTLPCSK